MTDEPTPLDAYRFAQRVKPGCTHQFACGCQPAFHLRASSPDELARIERIQRAFGGAVLIEHEKEVS